MNNNGYIQIYTGNGKGKTTSALGLILRAVGAGHRVCMLQFMKGKAHSEHEALRLLGDAVKVELLGHEEFYMPQKGKKGMHVALARKGLERAQEVLKSQDYNLVVLDEVITAVSMDLIKESELIKLIKEKPINIELVLTGRGATEMLIEHADLVTEMKEVRHYYAKGVAARRGIEY